MKTKPAHPQLHQFLSDRMVGPLGVIQRAISGISCDDPEIAKSLERIAKAAVSLSELIDAILSDGLPTGEAKARLRHDLRSRLNLILGYAELAEEDLQSANDAAAIEGLKAIQLAARDLVVSVDALVDLDSPKPSAALAADWQDLNLNPGSAALVGRILIVDDSEATRDLADRYLTPQGHTITQAASGKEALEKLKTQTFDLILLDMVMPGLSGLDVLERLKNTESDNWKIPVIVISGLTDVSAIALCVSAGAEDYLTKPFNPVLLRARIESSLQKKALIDREAALLRRIEAEKAANDTILSAILPNNIIKRLQNNEYPIADHHPAATVLFADIVGFTKLSSQIAPNVLVSFLDQLFSRFDALASKHDVEKIKTIGDGYMACCGVSEPHRDHAARCAHLACDMMTEMARLAADQPAMRLRVGLHSGPVVAGLIGRNRYSFDIWGATVNCASRIESAAPAGSICVSQETADAIGPAWNLKPIGTFDLRGIGRTPLFQIENSKR